MPINLGFNSQENNIYTPNNSTLTNNLDGLNQNNVDRLQSNNNNADNDRRITNKLASILDEQCYLQNSSIHRLVGIILTLLLAWVAAYTLLKHAFQPKSDLFQICLVVVCSYTTGCIFTVIGLPHVVGMFTVGSVLRSIGYFNLSTEYHSASVILRLFAISVTITKSALGVNTGVILKYKWSILKCAFIPGTTEAVAFAIMAKYIFNFPWLWSFLAGYIVCAMSSAPSLNALMNLKKQGIYRNDKMKSIIENSSYIDNIYSIVAFTICLNTIDFSRDGETYKGILYGLLDILVAGLIGFTLSSLTACFPHKNDKFMVQKRCLLAILNGTCTYFGCKVIGFPSGGAFSCFIAATTSTFYWKIQGWSDTYNPVLHFESKLWNFMMEPLLFGLVGTEINLRSVEVYEIGTIIGILVVLIVIRCIMVMLVLAGEQYNIKEKLFFTLAWMPKATVQAALCPQTLDMIRSGAKPREDELERGRMIIRMSVLAVVVVTTLSSIAIKICNKKLLYKKEKLQETA